MNALDHLQILLYYLGTFESQSLRAMHRYVGPGKTLLDVGANIGLFSVEAIMAGADAISIEAAPKHVEVLRKSGLPNIIHCAASDCDGQTTLSLPDGANEGMYTIGNVCGTEAFTVPTRRIDEVVGGRHIDFIKMDIEGAEYKALLGAEKTIGRCHPPILIELNERALQACGSNPAQVKSLLNYHGYVGRYVKTDKLIKDEDRHDCDECLFIAKH
jgi:FkbM family methyltransferase